MAWWSARGPNSHPSERDHLRPNACSIDTGPIRKPAIDLRCSPVTFRNRHDRHV